MAEDRTQRGEPAWRRVGVFGPWAFCLLSPAFCLLPAGCSPDDFAANDPLIGGPPVRPPNGAGVAPIQPVAATTVPPVPQPASSGTPAALTGASRGTLDPGRDLRIGGDNPAPTWQPSGGGPGGVALQPPQPIVGGPVPLQPGAPSAPVPGGTATPTYEQLMNQLEKHGVSRLVIVPDAKTGDVTWSCVVVPAEAGKPLLHYDVRNPHDPAAALQALLTQIEKPPTDKVEPRP